MKFGSRQIRSFLSGHRQQFSSYLCAGLGVLLHLAGKSLVRSPQRLQVLTQISKVLLECTVDLVNLGILPGKTGALFFQFDYLVLVQSYWSLKQLNLAFLILKAPMLLFDCLLL